LIREHEVPLLVQHRHGGPNILKNYLQ
jgi:hypothetical protein